MRRPTPMPAPSSRFEPDAPAPASRPVSRRTTWSRAGDPVAAVLLVGAIAAFLIRKAGVPSDFQTFYYAALAELRGLDPYRLESLQAVAGKSVVLPFLYPPVTLALFAPFTALPIAMAGLFWLGLKLAMAAFLIVIWRRWFLPDTSLALLVLVASFGFNGSLLWDLTTGNISVPEQLLLWAAFACYVEERRRWFTALVAIASVFKLLPIALLGLLLVPSKRHRPSTGLALTLGFGDSQSAVIGGTYLLGSVSVAPALRGRLVMLPPSLEGTISVAPALRRSMTLAVVGF